MTNIPSLTLIFPHLGSSYIGPGGGKKNFTFLCSVRRSLVAALLSCCTQNINIENFLKGFWMKFLDLGFPKMLTCVLEEA